MEIKIRANKALFDRWVEIGHAVINLNSIVQNDMHISQRQFAVWQKQSAQVQRALQKLSEETIQHVTKPKNDPV